MTAPATVYLFRDSHFAPSGNTVVCCANRKLVASVYGAGGVHDTAGLCSSFEGAAVFVEDVNKHHYLGVWGSRNASRFRSDVRRAGYAVTIVKEPPPGRMMYWQTRDAAAKSPVVRDGRRGPRTL